MRETAQQDNFERATVECCQKDGTSTQHEAQLCWGTILWKKCVQLAHHDFRFKWKKEMQNEYPHDIFVN